MNTMLFSHAKRSSFQVKKMKIARSEKHQDCTANLPLNKSVDDVTISIVIPTYNRGAAISETIESVLAQTLQRDQIEIIIIDDGSTDDTLSFLDIEYSMCENLRVIAQQNAGVANARNRGLREARGEYIAFLDHDDLWLPTKLEKQLALARLHHDQAVVYCQWRNVEVADLELQNDSWKNAAVLPPRLLEGALYRTFLRYNLIISMSVPLIPRALLDEIGEFDATLAPNDDWDLWIRLAQKSHFVAVAEPLVLYAVHAQQQSQISLRIRQTTAQVVIKQWPQVRRNPLLAFHALRSVGFLQSSKWYNTAKTALCQSRWFSVAAILVWVALRYPFGVLSPEWLYVAKRLITRNSQPY